MNSKECKICKEATKQKYRLYTVWKVLAIVFMCLTVLFATLYFASGDIFKQTNNDVEILNEEDGNNNNNVIINN